ncbi:50S ribosomal protein L25/general stress protein Ctc [Borrelia sp. BU AG58]|uniref:50S ribosomal protein L25/general stress protein Ctc n=1 Tax=Borrelia sp. BU AG58 TaxID=2887345 RepID=UPI001E577651|nr:50S ribosomal protein L25/general stress protein Ctc [Borrelia sp. BU AG58]UER67927.1 50S ribosomal protein L25/general stress protein Ctc [Borrelia sp. BU AG58]
MDSRVLNCERRLDFGSSCARRLRLKHEIPAVVYGGRSGVVHIKVKSIEFGKKFGKFTDNTVLILRDGDVDRCVFIKSVDENLTGKLIYHIDFYEVDRELDVERDVEIRFVGASIGVKEGGVLSVVKNRVRVRSLPLELPQFIEVDLSPVKRGDQITFGDIALPDKVKLSEENDSLVVLLVK